jgi:Replication initiator protein A
MAGLSGRVDKLTDILTRFQRVGERAAKEEKSQPAGVPEQGRGHLLPDRHPNRDFFIADLVEWAIKDDRHSMEHPMFSLSKNPDRKIRRYEHNGNTVVIAPGAYGLATIWDKDILIYAVSQLVGAMNADRKDLSPNIRLTAYDLLVSTNRHTGGGDYDQLQKAFERLSGTRITTDIRTNGVRQREGSPCPPRQGRRQRSPQAVPWSSPPPLPNWYGSGHASPPLLSRASYDTFFLHHLALS